MRIRLVSGLINVDLEQAGVNDNLWRVMKTGKLMLIFNHLAKYLMRIHTVSGFVNLCVEETGVNDNLRRLMKMAKLMIFLIT